MKIRAGIIQEAAKPPVNSQSSSPFAQSAMATRSLACQLLSRAMSALTFPTISPFPSRVRHLCTGVRSVCDRGCLGNARGLPSRLQAQGLSTVSGQALKEVLERELAYEKSEYSSLPVSPVD